MGNVMKPMIMKLFTPPSPPRYILNCNNLLRFAAVLSALPFFWSSAFAAQDLYFNTADSPDFNRYLNDSSNWFTDEGRTQQFEGTLGPDYNGIVSGVTVIAVSGTDLNLNSLSITCENGAKISLTLGSSITLAQDLTFDMNSGGISGNMALYNSIKVGGNMTIDCSSIGEETVSTPEFSLTGQSTRAKIDIDGDFSVRFGSQSAEKLQMYTSTDISIGGIMRMDNLWWQNSSKQHYHTLGGMSGNGDIVLYNGSISMNLTNSTAQETSLTFGTTTENSTFDISMNGSAAGRQTIRFRAGTPEGTDGNINDVTVGSGRLDIGMRTGMTGNRLSLSGTEAVFSATASYSGEIGTVTFNEGEWYAGKIAIDIEGELAYDKIAFNGRFDKIGSDRDMGFEFVFDAYAMRELISENGGELILEDVITYETGSSMAGTVFEGNTSGIQWEAVFGDTSLSVTFTVPEPATVAAVLGAAALAFAALRRRK